MAQPRDTEYLQSLLSELLKLPQETEWVEFKHNNDDSKAIGEYISALANSAALSGKQSAYVVWGVEDSTHKALGTTFTPSTLRHKQQELESWLLQKCAPKLHFTFYEFVSVDDLPMVILEIPAASHTPVQFDGVEYIRVGSYKKSLRGFPEKERELWRVFDQTPFEKQMALENLTIDEVLRLLDYSAYFDLTKSPLPDGKNAILAALQADKLVDKAANGQWNISNLGAVLFAKQLRDFPSFCLLYTS